MGSEQMDSSYFWTSIVGLGVGTYAIRSILLFMSSKIKISEGVKDAFTFIPAAIIPAILGPMVFFHNGDLEIFLGKERLLVLVFATVVCYFTKSMLATIVFGLSTLYFLKLFLS